MCPHFRQNGTIWANNFTTEDKTKPSRKLATEEYYVPVKQINGDKS